MRSKIKNIIRSRGWSRKTVIRYILLQIPSFLILTVILYFVQKPFELPYWSIILILFLWILKDFVMFFFVWRAYIPSGAENPTKMIGRTGITSEKLDPAGYVQIGGELWYAEVRDKKKIIEPDCSIVVRESHGLTLFVEQNEKDNNGT